MTKHIATLITGSFAKLPGAQVLAVLPAGAKLRLVPEPENPYDAAAIRVECVQSAIPPSQYQELADRLEGTGWAISDVQELEAINLGFVAASDGKPLARAGLTVGNREVAARAQQLGLEAPWDAELCFGPSGEPMLRLTAGGEE